MLYIQRFWPVLMIGRGQCDADMLHDSKLLTFIKSNEHIIIII